MAHARRREKTLIKTSVKVKVKVLLDKLITNGVPAHIVRWLADILIDRQQQVKIGKTYSRTGSPNGGVHR